MCYPRSSVSICGYFSSPRHSPVDSLHQVVIIGGGFGGLYAARSLRRSAVRVTLVDRRNYHLFQPLLYQVACAALGPADIAQPIRTILRYQQNARVMLAQVDAIDLAARRVIADGVAVRYDYLVLAPGAVDNYFGHEDWRHFAPGMKAIEEATFIRSRLLRSFEIAEIEPDPAERADRTGVCSQRQGYGNNAPRWRARARRAILVPSEDDEWEND